MRTALCLLILAAAGPAVGTVAPGVGHLVEESSLVVVATVERVEPAAPPADKRLTLAVKRVVKGSLPGKRSILEVTVFPIEKGTRDFDEAVKSGARRLFLLRPAKDGVAYVLTDAWFGIEEASPAILAEAEAFAQPLKVLKTEVLEIGLFVTGVPLQASDQPFFKALATARPKGSAGPVVTVSWIPPAAVPRCLGKTWASCAPLIERGRLDPRRDCYLYDRFSDRPLEEPFASRLSKMPFMRKVLAAAPCPRPADFGAALSSAQTPCREHPAIDASASLKAVVKWTVTNHRAHEFEVLEIRE